MTTHSGMTLGNQVRAFRRLQGKSLRKLAADLGMSPGALSMLENDRKGVSLKRLQVIAESLGVPIVQLLAAPPQQRVPSGSIQVVRNCFNTVPGVLRKPGVVYQVVGLEDRREIQPVLVSFAPGSGYMDDRIQHSGEEAVYVVAGQVELHAGNEVQTLNQGDLAVYSSEYPHAYRNASEVGPALIFIACTRPW